MKKEQYRHEWKYRISEEEHDLLSFRLSGALKLDSHAKDGGYLIRSLYFDDYMNSAYEEKDAGVLTRKKYRIRIYNYGSDVIHLRYTGFLMGITLFFLKVPTRSAGNSMWSAFQMCSARR